MFQEFFSRSDHLIWPLIGLILFVAIFLGVLAYVFFGLRDRRKVDEIAALPFEPEIPVDHETVKDMADGRARS